MYIAEISTPNIRGSLVSLQQLAITVGVSETTSSTSTDMTILTPTNVSLLLDVRGILMLNFFLYMIIYEDWIAYATSYLGGTRCAPGVPYTGPLSNGSPTFDPYTDIPNGGCTGQTQASWRIPLGLQLFPALVCQLYIFCLSLYLWTWTCSALVLACSLCLTRPVGSPSMVVRMKLSRRCRVFVGSPLATVRLTLNSWRSWLMFDTRERSPMLHFLMQGYSSCGDIERGSSLLLGKWSNVCLSVAFLWRSSKIWLVHKLQCFLTYWRVVVF